MELGFLLRKNAFLGVATLIYSLDGFNDDHDGLVSWRQWMGLYHSTSSSTPGLTSLFFPYGILVVCPHSLTRMLWAPCVLLIQIFLESQWLKRASLHSFLHAQEVGQAGYASGGDPGFGHGLLSARGMSQVAVLGFANKIYGLGVDAAWMAYLLRSPKIMDDRSFLILTVLDSRKKRR